MTEIIIPTKKGHSVFSKAGKRNALAIAICNQAVYMETEQGKIKDIRVALGSVAPTAVRAYHTEAMLRGTEASALDSTEFKVALKEALLKDICPIDVSQPFIHSLCFSHYICAKWPRVSH